MTQRNRKNYPGFTDHRVVVEPSNDPRSPFQVRWSYTWAGKRTSEISYYRHRSSANRAARRFQAEITRPYTKSQMMLDHARERGIEVIDVKWSGIKIQPADLRGIPTVR